MKVPESYVGQVVGIHLARPVYLFEYGAHVTIDSAEQPAVALLSTPARDENGAPRIGPDNKPLMQAAPPTDWFMGVVVREVTEDAIAFDMLVPHQGSRERACIIRKRIPATLVMSIDVVEIFDTEIPTSRSRFEPSRIVKP